MLNVQKAAISKYENRLISPSSDVFAVSIDL